MRPSYRNAEEESSQDSFLDVVANVVGVLIILVMLVGVKASLSRQTEVSSPHDSEDAAQQEASTLAKLEDAIHEAQKSALASQQEVKELASRLLSIRKEAVAQDMYRVQLASHRAVIEEDLTNRREQLDSQQKQQFDVQRKIFESQQELEKLTQEQLSLLSQSEPVEELELVPTPLAKEVDEDAIHLRVKNGLISIVPLIELLDEVQYHIEEIRRRLQQNGRVVETLGPIDGYRLRLTAVRGVSSDAVEGPRAGRVQRTVVEHYTEILPNADKIGQNVEQALMPGGTVHEYLESRRRKSPPVVVWLYTDSFDDFRLIKRTLWEMGFSLATRPMRPGTNIGTSPHGTKAAVQ